MDTEREKRRREWRKIRLIELQRMYKKHGGGRRRIRKRKDIIDQNKWKSRENIGWFMNGNEKCRDEDKMRDGRGRCACVCV
jgi:hypothetical protein